MTATDGLQRSPPDEPHFIHNLSIFMKILIVDDSKAMRMIIVRTLKQAGFSGHAILEACNGAEALEVATREKPNLILSDWNMPEMKGIDFLQKLREVDSRVHFGFITTESSAEARKQAEEAGAAFLIRKPFTPEAFITTLNPFLC